MKNVLRSVLVLCLAASLSLLTFAISNSLASYNAKAYVGLTQCLAQQCDYANGWYYTTWSNGNDPAVCCGVWSVTAGRKPLSI